MDFWHLTGVKLLLNVGGRLLEPHTLAKIIFWPAMAVALVMRVSWMAHPRGRRFESTAAVGHELRIGRVQLSNLLWPTSLAEKELCLHLEVIVGDRAHWKVAKP